MKLAQVESPSLEAAPPPALEPERKPTAVESTLKAVWDRIVQKRNTAYTKSRFSVEGSGFTMFSSDQVANSDDPPFALLLGLKVQHWMDDVGVGGLFRSKVIDVSGNGAVSPTSIEARIARRWTIPFGFFDNSSSQFSLIAAAEIYRSAGSPSQFSSGYDMLKAGFGLDFPIFHNWDTGGEVLIGKAFDSSTKYEISGFIDYYIKKDVSFGTGYRIHLFEAGSTKSAPATLPYREGYGEAYSTLRWHY